MANIHKRIADILSELTEFVNDAIEGYEKAAAETRNTDHRLFYKELAQERMKFSTELNILIESHGGKSKKNTTIRGKIYRQWMQVKALLTNRDDKAILSSSIYGEEWAQEAYTDALLKDDLPQNIRQLIERQRQASIAAAEKLFEMKQEAKHVNK